MSSPPDVVFTDSSQNYHDRYGTSGYLYDGEYRAKRIDTPAQFRWRVAYVHANSEKFGLDYEFSTHRCYVDENQAGGALDLAPALKLFGGREGYLEYMSRRETRQRLDRELRFDDP